MNEKRARLAVGLWSVAFLPHVVEARFLQTDPIGTKDDLNLYAYTYNDPVNRSDSRGMYSCGSSLSTSECADFKTAQDTAKTNLSSTMRILTGMQYKLDSGGKLSAVESRVAGRIDKLLGEGAGTNPKVLSSLLATGKGMLGVLNGNTPADHAIGSRDYAHADPGRLALFPNYFRSSAQQQAETVAHESSHHGADTIDLRMDAGFGKPSIPVLGDQNVSAAAIKFGITRMLEVADAVTLALGMKRDDAFQ